MGSTPRRQFQIVFLVIVELLLVSLSGCKGKVDDESIPSPTPAPSSTPTAETHPNLLVDELWIQTPSTDKCDDSGRAENYLVVRIINAGDADAGAFHILINETQEEVVSGVQANASVVIEFSSSAERIFVLVDNRNEIPEQDEEDNDFETKVLAPSQDLCSSFLDATPDPNIVLFQLLPADLPINIIQIQMFNETEGWGIGEQEEGVGHILRTSDGGKTWLDVSPPEQFTKPESPFMRATAFFMNTEKAWVTYQMDPGGQPGTIWRTRDGGLTWKQSWRRMSGVYGSASSWATLEFVDESNGWLLIDHFVGASIYETELYQTTDGGITWGLIQNDQATPWMVGSTGGIDFWDNTYGLITSTSPSTGSVFTYQTGDSGKTWTEFAQSSPDSNSNLFELLTCGLSAPKLFSYTQAALSVFCYNTEGVSASYLYRTEDAGINWQTYPFPGKFRGVSVDVVGQDLGFILGRSIPTSSGDGGGESAELYKSMDEGKNWEKVAEVSWYGRIHFIDDLVGWAIARLEDGNALLFTVDGGLSWEQLHPLTIVEEGMHRSIVQTPGVIFPEDLLQLTLVNADKVHILDVQLSGLVSDLEFTPNGEALLLAQTDGWIAQWPVGISEAPLAVFKHPELISDVDVALDGGTITSASRDGTIWVWFTGSPVQFSLQEDLGEESAIVLSPDGTLLASTLKNGGLKLWNLSESRELEGRNFGGSDGSILDISFSPDGQKLAGVASDGSVCIWDSVSGDELLVLEGYKYEATNIAYAPDGNKLASAFGDGSIRIWDLGLQGEPLILENVPAGINALAYSPDGVLLAAGSTDGSLYLWDVSTSTLMNVLGGHRTSIQNIAFSPDGKILASISQDGITRFWGIRESTD